MERRTSSRAFRDGLIVIIFSITLLAVMSVLAVRYSSRQRQTVPPRPIFVMTVAPERAYLRRTLSFSSTLDAESSVSVMPRVSGSITGILVEEATVVAPGDLLARIDPEPYRLEMKAAESAWLLAESSYTRIERLYSGSGASRQQLEEAAASRDAAKSSFELARMQFEYSEVRAPVGGVVLSRFAEEGGLAMPGQPLFVIGNDDSYRVVVRVPEKHWAEFENPGAIQVQVDLPGSSGNRKVPARILRLSPAISPADRTFRVTCAVERSAVSWPLGTRLNAVFTLREKENTWSLPLKAIGADSSLWWVDRKESTAHITEAPGSLRDDSRLEIPEAWSDRIFVLEGQHRLRENMPVTPVSADSGILK